MCQCPQTVYLDKSCGIWYDMIYEIKSETESPIEIDITVSAASLTAEHEQIRKCKGQINIEK